MTNWQAEAEAKRRAKYARKVAGNVFRPTIDSVAQVERNAIYLSRARRAYAKIRPVLSKRGDPL